MVTDARPYDGCVQRGCIRRGSAARAADSRPYGPGRWRVVGAAFMAARAGWRVLLPPPNLVGRHGSMPPWQGCDDCGPGGCGSLVWRGVGTPPYGPGRTYAVGAAISRPNRLPILALPPSNAVGRHAHMPPRPGCDDRGPWRFRRCVPGGYIIRPYRPAPSFFVGADAHIGPQGPVCKAVRRTLRA